MTNFEVISYGKLYLRILYRWWDPNVSCYGDCGPFWAFEGPPPSLLQVQKGQLNCAGFVNVLCRHLGIKIPGVEEKSYYAGGTYEWFVHLDSKQKLKPFLAGTDYPTGSLLLRRYRSEEDQGHLAVVVGPGTIIHSYPEKGVCFDRIYEKYYEYVALPEDWIQ